MSIDHSRYHSSNSFCGNAGPEEMKHLADLLDELTLGQIYMLAEACGLGISENVEREDLVNIIDEVDREDFYREYRNIVKNNVCLQTSED